MTKHFVSFFILCKLWLVELQRQDFGVMRLTSLEVSEARYNESKDTFHTKHSDSITKSKDPIVEIEVQMERLKKPPPKRDFTYFMKIGFNGSSLNPLRLKAGCDLPMEKLV